MHVGAALVELRIHGSRSLKDRRGVVRSIVQRVRNQFNVAVAEVGGQDTWSEALLGMTTTGNDPVRIRQVLERTIDFIEDLHLAELVAHDVELMRFPDVSELPASTFDDDEEEDEEE